MSRWEKMRFEVKKILGKLAVAAGCGAVIFGGGLLTPAPAFASEVTEAEAVVEESVLEEGADVSDPEENTGEETAGRVIGEGTETGNPDSSAFSVEGNAEIVDHITDGSTKEFYTIRTANNNTFYLVIDHSNTTNNVYMLSTIDENDLQDFLEEENADSGVLLDTPLSDTETPAEAAEEIEEETLPEETDETTEPEETRSGNWTHLAGIAVGIAVLLIAFLFIKKKQGNSGKKEEEPENIEYSGQEPEEVYEHDDTDEIYTEDDFADLEDDPEETEERDTDDFEDEAYAGEEEPLSKPERARKN